MWHVWRRYSSFYLFIIVLLSSCNISDDSEAKNKVSNLLLELSLRDFTGKLIILSEAECIGCSLNKSIYAINKRVKRSDSLKVVLFKISKYKIDTKKLEEVFPQVKSYIYTKNLDLMLALAEATKKKSGPYYLECDKGEIKHIEGLGFD